jgi:hypothetical protein
MVSYYSTDETYAMPSWRMAFRCGKDGYEMWPHCHRLGVAIIEYGPGAERGQRTFPPNDLRCPLFIS